MTVERSMPETIETERLILRGFVSGDFPAYCAYYTGERTAGVGGPLPEHRVFERFCAMIGHWDMRGYGRYAITAGGGAFGHVGPMALPGSSEPEMTWTIWDAARTGQGYATEAARAVLRAWNARHEAPLVAIIDRENAASLRMAARLGGVEDAGAALPAHLPNARRFVLAAEDAAA